MLGKARTCSDNFMLWLYFEFWLPEAANCKGRFASNTRFPKRMFRQIYIWVERGFCLGLVCHVASLWVLKAPHV